MVWDMLKACLGGPFGILLHMIEVHYGSFLEEHVCDIGIYLRYILCI
jgi:hypothetical protein